MFSTFLVIMNDYDIESASQFMKNSVLRGVGPGSLQISTYLHIALISGIKY